MRRGWWVVLIGAVLVTAAFGALMEQSPTLAQAPPGFTGQTAPGEMIAFSHEIGEGRQQVTVIDPKAQVLAVYHVERGSGQITLKGVRSIHWDLQMEEFNGVSPLPRDIRALLEQR